MFKAFKRRKRQQLRDKPFPNEWVSMLENSVRLYALLPEADRRELHGHIQVFLEEKRFEGCEGFVVTDEARLLIASQACVLLLHRDTDYFPHMVSIFIYPTEFYVDVAEQDGVVVNEFSEDRTGESWDRGPIVLSWEDVASGAAGEFEGYNVVLHEFVHQLDMENGALDGMPALPDAAAREEWSRVFGEAYQRHLAEVESGRRTAIDEYGAQSPEEFFAVAVEGFFDTPEVLHEHYPAVYDALAGYFQQNPLQW